MVSVEVARTPSRATPIEPDDATPPASPFPAVWILLLWQTGALIVTVLAGHMARQDANAETNAGALVLSSCGFALTFASALWFLTRPRLARAVRNAAVVCLGVTSAVQWRMNNPLLFTCGYDEQQHMRTLSDIVSSHGFYQPNPGLPISPRYPGLESLTVLFHQLGLPVMAAALAVVFVARLVLVLALCDAVEHLTGSSRAGGLAVAAYAVSSSFVYFNTQFAYQTLALPLALAAVALIARARWVSDPRLLLSGACVCLLAVVVTHHVTSWLTVGFLAVWTIAQRGGQARRRVFYSAVIAVVATTAWAIIQWSLLRDYFGPIIEDYAGQITGGLRRKPFSDSAGTRDAPWEQVFILSYAVSVTLVSSWLVLIWARSIQLRLRPGARFKPARDVRRTVGNSSTVSHRCVKGAPLTYRHTASAHVSMRGGADSLRRRRDSQTTGCWPSLEQWWSSVKRPPRRDSQRWEPPVLLMLMVAMIPVLFAARIMPSGAELCDRSSGFLFFPLSLLVADGAVRWSRSGPRRQLRSRPWDALRVARQVMLVRSLTLVLATSAFVGAYLTGSGPDWAREPGRYLASAYNRQMDSETFAAARWARDALPAGSRIGTDVEGFDVLAGQAHVWTVIQEFGMDVTPFYFADQWGPAQTELARRMHLRYLYVDRRLADSQSHSWYFFKNDKKNDETDESQKPEQLTRVELTKFDTVPGIRAIYRHGPIAIYDLNALGVVEWRYGWSGETRPNIGVPVQLGVGLLLGLALTLVRSTVIKTVRTFRTAAGPSLTFAAGVGALCIASVTMLLAHIWLGPTVFLSMALVVLLANRHWATDLLRKSAARLRWRRIAASTVVAVLVAAAIALSILDVDASPWGVRRIQEILDDPSAVHIPVQIAKSAGSAACAWRTTASCDEAL